MYAHVKVKVIHRFTSDSLSLAEPGTTMHQICTAQI